MIQEDESNTPLQEKISGLGKALGLIALVVCTGVFALQFLNGIPLVENFLTAVSLAVAAVPEGLPAILTLTLAMGMQRMAKTNAIVRKLVAVETLGSCTVICTDKTGTLTKNKMTVTDSNITSSQKAFEICALCNNAYYSDRKIKGDPTDAALLTFADKNSYNKEKLDKKYPRLSEIPLDSIRKRMTTINQINGQKYLLIKGAPEIIINKCEMIDNNGAIQKITPKDKTEIFNTLNKMTGNALRVLALAYKKIDDISDSDIERIEKNLVYVGLVGMIDPPRKEVAESVRTCKKAGIKIVMITGDHKETATAIAKQINILDGGKVLTGTELNEISDDEFAEIVEDINVYARVLPEQKVRIVNALQKKDHIVSMTGDGVNDAPALKKAAIGVSMGSGTDVAKESSDMVLQDDNFTTIVKAIKEGRTIFDNIRRFVKFQVSTNVGAILTIVSSSLLNLPIPFNPIQILWINIIMDGPPAQSLGVEPPESGIMERKPERGNIIPRKNYLRIAFAGVLMAVGTLLVYYFELLNGASHLKATTIAFTLFVMFRIVNVFNNKSKTGFSNRFLLMAVAASFILQLCVVYLPVLQNIFRTTSISIIDWILILLVAPILFISERIVDKFEKRTNDKTQNLR
jgi:Ca2+-transporting ATPase